MSVEEDLLRAILTVTARQTFTPEKLGEIVGTGKQLAAYNLCDGTRTQAEIVRSMKLDSSNFAKTVARWEKSGVVFRLGQGDVKLQHAYPLEATKKKGGGK